MTKEDKPQTDQADQEHRCICGQLLARLTVQGVEIKCRRCKRTQTVRWQAVNTLNLL